MEKVHTQIVEATRLLSTTGIAKNRRNEQQRFMFRGIEDVYAAVAPVLVQTGLTITPASINVLSESSAPTSKGGAMRMVRILVTYRVTAAEDGSSITVDVLGEGADMADKACGKAMAYAYKTMIFQTFCVPVEGQPDTDRESIEPSTIPVEETLLADSRAAAMDGMDAYKAFFSSLPRDKKQILVQSGAHDLNKQTAAETDIATAS